MTFCIRYYEPITTFNNSTTSYHSYTATKAPIVHKKDHVRVLLFVGQKKPGRIKKNNACLQKNNSKCFDFFPSYPSALNEFTFKGIALKISACQLYTYYYTLTTQKFYLSNHADKVSENICSYFSFKICTEFITSIPMNKVKQKIRITKQQCNF